MESPAARFTAALVLLVFFYWALLVPNVAVHHEEALFDREVEGLLAASRTLYERARYQEALAPTLSLTDRLPGQQVNIERLAHIYHHLARYADEAEAWHLFMDRSPTPWDACPAVANAHTAAGDERLAFAAFEECWRLAPWDADLGFFLGRAHEHRNELAAAAAVYRAALDRDAGHADSRLGLARLDLRAGRLDEARRRALSVADQFPAHADAWLVMAQAAQRGGDMRAARRYFTRTLQIEERYADAYIGLGILDYGDGNRDDARRHFERALDLDGSRRAELTPWLARAGATR